MPKRAHGAIVSAKSEATQMRIMSLSPDMVSENDLDVFVAKVLKDGKEE